MPQMSSDDPHQTILDYASPPSRSIVLMDRVRRGAAMATLIFTALFVGSWTFLLWMDRDDSGPYMGLAVLVGGVFMCAAISAGIWLVAVVAKRIGIQFLPQRFR